MRRPVRALCAIVAVIGLFPAVSQAGFTQIVAFGDSLIDTGNVYAATGGTTPPSGLGYDNGRFSNGPVWVEGLAAKLGVAAPTPSLLGGTNYAFGGAATGVGFSSQGTLNINSQVGLFLGGGGTLNANQLVVIDGGANDFLNEGQTNPFVPIANLDLAIRALAAAGGQTFLLQNLPALGQIPATSIFPQAVRDGLDALSLGFNALLAGEAALLESTLNIKVRIVDVQAAIILARTNPGAYGLTNTTTSALFDGVSSGQGYLFWDTVHPTAIGHEIIAGLAYDAIVTPEPSTWIVAGMGILISGGACLRRKRLQSA